MKRLKIAILTDLFYPYQLGGAEKQFYELTSRLAKKHEVHVFTLNIEGQPSEEVVNNIHMHRFGFRNPLRKRSLFSLGTFFFKIPFFLKKLKKFDIIHANQIAGLFSFFRYALKKPFILTLHDIYWDLWKKYYIFPFYYIGKFVELLSSKLYYNRIITVSDASKNKIRQLGFNSKIEILPNGIDSSFISKIKAKKGNHLVYVGRLVNYKNVDKIILAMKEVEKHLPGIELRIIGSGNIKPDLQKLSKDLGVKVKFLGYVSEEEKFRQIKSARAFVSMSSVEGFGISVLEAMACGTPVIAKKLPAYREFCNSMNSLLIDDNDLEKTIVNLFKNKKLQESLSKNSLETARKFDWDNVVERLEKIYQSVL